MKRLSMGVLLVVFELFGADLQAQSGGILVVNVTDRQSGRPVEGARTHVLGTESRQSTDPRGQARMPQAPVGTWSIEVRALGYGPMILTDVVVRASRVTTLEVEMSRIPIQLEGIEVRPSYFPVLDTRPIEATGFSSEEIRRAPGAAGDVSRILQTLPSLAKVNDQNNGLIVRGGSPLENLFLVDGIEIGNINHFPIQGASSGPIGLLNVDLVRELDFYAGAFDAEYGDRLSSVMDIKLREGNREEFDAQFDLNFAGVGGVVEGPISGRGSWMAAARRSYVDLAVKAFDVGSTVAPVYGDYQGKITFDLDPSHRLGLVAVWADDHLQTDLATAKSNAMLAFGGQDLWQGTTGLTWTALWSDNANSVTSLSHGLSRFDEDYFETATDGNALFSNRSFENAVRMRHRTEIFAGETEIAFGFDTEAFFNSYENTYATRVGAFGDTVAGTVVNEDLRGARGGMFSGILLPLSSSVDISVGARMDYSTKTKNLTVSPRTSIGLRLNQGTKLTAGVGLFRQGLPAVMLAQSRENLSLPDMRSIHAVIGFRSLLSDDLRLGVDAYHKSTDFIPTDPNEPQLLPIDELFLGSNFLSPRDTLTSDGRARTSGVEVQLHKKMSGSTYGMVAASFFRSRYSAADGVWRDRVFDNRVTVSAAGGWRVGRGFELSARWILAGGVPFTPLDVTLSQNRNRSVLDMNRINEARYPAYHSLNTRVDHRSSIGATTLTWYISIWNTYNRKNIAQYYWNADVGQEEAIRQWGLLPIFGIEWEF